MKKWKVLESKYVLENPYFKVKSERVELGNGKIVEEFLYWEEGHVVATVAVTKEQEVVLVKQYRHGYGDFIIELPAGFIDEGEDRDVAVERELSEETGYKGEKVTFLGELVNKAGKSTGRVYLYLIEGIVQDSDQHLDETEDIEVMKVPYRKALEMIRNGEIVQSATIAGIYKAADKLGIIKNG